MDRPKLLSAFLVVTVVLWTAGSAVELFSTTLSVGPNVGAAAATVAFLAVVTLTAVGLGARSRRWIENPRSYW